MSPEGGRKMASTPAVVSLTAGTQLNASNMASAEGLAAKPISLNVEQLKAVTQTAKVEDNTFRKEITIESNNGPANNAANSNGGGNAGAGGGPGPRGPASTNGPGGEGPKDGGATTQVLAEVVSAPVQPMMPPSVTNPSANGPVPRNVFNPPQAIVPVGGIKHVHVVITK